MMRLHIPLHRQADSIVPRFTLFCTLTAVMLFSLGGCAGDKTSDKSIAFITLDQAQRLVAGERNLFGAGKAATWVDARTKTDFDAGHIPGAVSLPFERASADHHLLKDLPILIVYGAEYNDARANGMSKRLRELLPGHDIRTFDGGVRAWTAAGNELDKSSGR